MQPETKPCDASVSPSFNIYSSTTKVAARVSLEHLQPDLSRDAGGSGEEDDDFEFFSLSSNPDDEFFTEGGAIRPTFPVFNRDLLVDSQGDAAAELEDSIRIPMKRLSLDDRDSPASSSSEADETERIAPRAYCCWSPKVEEKSNSTRSSRRSKWSMFRDLLKRSNKQSGKAEKGGNSKEKKAKGKVGIRETKTTSVHEKLYVRNGKMKEDKRGSCLPCRQDLVGFFVNGLGMTFPHF